MSKIDLKNTITPMQGGVCALTGTPIDLDRPELVDTDRIAERAKDGGTYTPKTPVSSHRAPIWNATASCANVTNGWPTSNR